MKYFRWFIIIVISFLAVIGYAQDRVYVNQISVECDPVAPIEPTDIITYQWWTDSVMLDKVMEGETNVPEFTFTHIIESEYILGVGTKREVVFPLFSEIVYSEINWSNINIPEGSTPNPFVSVYIKPIQSPENLRLP